MGSLFRTRFLGARFLRFCRACPDCCFLKTGFIVSRLFARRRCGYCRFIPVVRGPYKVCLVGKDEANNKAGAKR